VINGPNGDAEHYRREAMGAFAHEVRTPLTSIRMVLELARCQSTDDTLVLDAELSAMLRQSVDDLQNLADDIQEASRLERGRLVVGSGPTDLSAAVDAARELLGGRIDIAGPTPDPIEGPWDAPRLVRAIAGFTESTNRIGDGSGEVRFQCILSPESVQLVFESGELNEPGKPIAADAGFGFFRSRQFVLAMGGSVDYARSERHARITATLPKSRAGASLM
jgi:signal transduction histidine kinase